MAVYAYLVRETEHARLYRMRGQRCDEPDIWFPKSVCEQTTKHPPAGAGKLPLHIIEVSGWFVREKNLPDS